MTSSGSKPSCNWAPPCINCLGQSAGWVETNPNNCLLVWDYLRSPAISFFCRVSKIGHDGFAGYLRLAMMVLVHGGINHYPW